MAGARDRRGLPFRAPPRGGSVSWEDSSSSRIRWPGGVDLFPSLALFLWRAADRREYSRAPNLSPVTLTTARGALTAPRRSPPGRPMAREPRPCPRRAGTGCDSSRRREYLVVGAALLRFTSRVDDLTLVWWEDDDLVYATASTAGRHDLATFALRCIRSGSSASTETLRHARPVSLGERRDSVG